MQFQLSQILRQFKMKAEDKWSVPQNTITSIKSAIGAIYQTFDGKDVYPTDLEKAAKRYIIASLKREFASENDTELNAILPKMSPLNPQYLSKKQSVFQKIAAFVEKFKGVGGG